jgi:hypothetical protein
LDFLLRVKDNRVLKALNCIRESTQAGFILIGNIVELLAWQHDLPPLIAYHQIVEHRRATLAEILEVDHHTALRYSIPVHGFPAHQTYAVLQAVQGLLGFVDLN